MEERNLEFDDDGKIKVRKAGGLEESQASEDGEIVIEVPDLGEQAEGASGIATEEELARRSLEQEKRREKRREEAEALYREGEALFAAGDLDGAGEKFLDSAALYGADWRPWFGVVRVQTRDFTEFGGIYECEQAYDKAFRRMTKEDRAQLAEKYGKRLEEKANECAQASERLNAQDAQEREELRPYVQSVYEKSLRRLIVSVILLAIFTASACAMAPFVRSVPDYSILIPCIVCAVVAVALLVVAIAFLRLFILAGLSRSANLRAGTTAAGDAARASAETEELIRSIIDDLQKS